MHFFIQVHIIIHRVTYKNSISPKYINGKNMEYINAVYVFKSHNQHFGKSIIYNNMKHANHIIIISKVCCEERA